MKKIIKSLALTLMTLTCIVFMSACGSNLPPENPEYELTVQSIHELIQSKGYEGTLDDFISTIKGKDGRSIVNIVLISSIEGVNTYRITYSDNTFSTFTIADGKDGSNGRGVVSISCLTISPSVTEYSTYRILYTDGTYFDYNVYNGKNGTDGKDGTSIASITQTNNDKDNSSTIIITDSNGATKEFTLYNGIDGKAGTGIETITKTSTDGLVDTYVITFTDNKEPFTYTVTNGSNGTDGVGIKELEINADGELEITLTDNDTSINLGKIKGKDGGTITKIEKTNSSGLIDTYTISCSDGKDFTFTVTNGKDGDDGRGIKSIAKLASTGMVDTYTITYSDNTTSSFTVTNGVGITYATLDSAGKLILSLSDGKTIDIGNVKGETGNGIVSIEKTKTDGLKDTYIITYTNGDTTTFTVVNGRGIKEIKKESNSLIDTYTITYTDNSTPYVFTVTNGQNGLSAYEIYKIYNPSYTKSESEWIVDLTNGDLSTNRFTVTFNSNGGTEVESQTNIKFGDKATKPTTPTREGYLFDGWYYDEEKWSFVGYSVTEDMTLTAVWSPITYIVSFDTNGYGDFEDISLTFEDDLVLPIIDIVGYTYNWKINGETITNGKWNIASDTTIELVLTPIQYPITYVLDEGTNDSNNPNTYTIESETITLGAAYKDNYYFVGWYLNSEFTGDKISEIERGSFGNVKLYAYFSNIVTVPINANGGKFDIEEKQFIIGEKFFLPEPVAPDGYVFGGWVANPQYTDTGFMYSYRPLDADTLIFPEMKEIVATWVAIFKVENGKITGLTYTGANQSVIKIPSQIDGVEITTLGEYCLYHNNANITEIYIPETITKMEFRAIYEVENLTKLYYNATDLIGLTVSDNGNFTDCGIKSGGYEIIIGKNVQSIPSYFMYNSENVYNRTNKVNAITFEEGSICSRIGSYAFAYSYITELVLPSTIETYGEGVFRDCRELKCIQGFRKNVDKINQYMFYNCQSLESFDIPNGITSIDKSAFAGCTTITEIIIPNSVVTIGEFAFADCSNVKTLTIGESVKNVYNYAFRNLSKVDTFNFNVTDINDFKVQYPFYINALEYRMEENDIFSGLGVDVAKTVLNIGKNVKRIPAYMLDSYTKRPTIEEVNYESGCVIEEYGTWAWPGQPLKTLTIPSSVKYIGAGAFCNMGEVEVIYFNAQNLSRKASGPDELYSAFAGIGKNIESTRVVFGEGVTELNENHVDLFKHYQRFSGDRTNIKIVDFSLNKTIIDIPELMFAQTYWLENLILSKNIINIGANAFYSESETTHINTIYYIGNQTEFAKIVVDNTDDGNKYFNSANVYYYSEPNGDVLNGFDNYWYFEDGEIKTWTAEKYTIIYNLFDGINHENNPSQFTKYESNIILQTPTKENYIFAGWFEDPNFEHEITTITEDRDYVLYAKWSFSEDISTYII